MPKVALFIAYDVYDGYESSMTTFGQKVSEWTDLTDEEFVLLRQEMKFFTLPGEGQLCIVEQKPELMIKEIIQASLDRRAKAEADRERLKQEEEKRKLASKLKKQARTEAEEKALLAALKEKYGEN